jgi:Mrp family chromosome partitioning ATPase
MNDRLITKFHLLRARIESDLKQPGVIMVTSAQRRDGKSLTAYGLAESLSRVGHRTALVDANAEARWTTQARLSNDRRGPSIVAMPREDGGASLSREAIHNFVGQMRVRFDFTVVDAAPLLCSSSALLLANEADGVLLSLRVGRAPCEEDALTVRMLRHARVSILGVVGATAEGIEQFEKTREAAASGESRVIVLDTQPSEPDDVLLAPLAASRALKRV